MGSPVPAPCVLLCLPVGWVWLAGWWPCRGGLGCSLLAVPLQVRERPLGLLGPRRAAGSAAAAVGPPVVPIRVLLSLLLVWVWLAGGGPVGVGWSARCSQFQFGAPSGEWVGWGALQMRSGAPGHPSKDTCGLIGSASAKSPRGVAKLLPLFR